MPSPFAAAAVEQIAVEALRGADAVLVVERFQAEFGGGEVKLVDVFGGGVGVDHDVDTLPLVDVLLALRGLLDNGQLADFREGFEDVFFFFRKAVQMLHRAVVQEDAFPDCFRIQAFFLQQFHQIGILVGGFDFGEIFDVVVGLEGLYRRRDAAEDKAARFGGRDAHQRGVAATMAFEDFGFAEFGGERFRGGKGFVVQEFEDFVVFLHGGEAVEGDAVRLQIAVPAEYAEAERAMALGKTVGAVEERDVGTFFDEFAHHGVEEAGEGFHGVGVFPFIVVEEVHGGEAADEAFVGACREHDFGAEVGGVDRHVKRFVDLGATGVGVVFEEKVGDAGFGAALQYFGPDAAFVGVACFHLIKPGVADAHAVVHELDGVALGVDIEPFVDVAVVDVDIACELAFARGALGDDVDDGVEKFAEVEGAVGFAVVADRTAARADMAEVGTGAAADFAHHADFGGGGHDVVDGVADVAAEAGDGQAAAEAEVGPHGRGEGEVAARHVVMEFVGKGGILQDFAGMVGYGADARFGRGAFKEIAPFEKEATVGIEPGEVGTGRGLSHGYLLVCGRVCA